MIHWDKLCQNRNKGGLGFKKFNLMNQAMLAKQFWRISHNPQSLLAKTFKAKYFPHCSIHECVPKPHHSWFWRNLIQHDNPKLKDGRWWIGNGRDIPLKHSDWFNCPSHNLQNPNLITGKVADLINHNSGEWKADLVRSIYIATQCSKILSIPISKTGAVSDKILWKHSTTGQHDVRTAYKILLKDEVSKFPFQDSPHHIQTERKSLLPICFFIVLSLDGSTLAIHSSDFNNISVQAWLKNIILRLRQLDQERMEYLCSIFTFLWTIWKHRNMVTHDGKTPNPTEVILTAQSLICRFKEAFETKINHDRPNKGIQPNHQNIGGCWDLIIKIAGARKARQKRTSFAYEASNLQGRTMFSGCASSGASTITAATQEALVVSAVKAKGLVYNTAKFALKVPGPCCWVHPAFA
uniref:Reverse transcriptase zinc-binding domain-containing protein n=1 Tax=Quercus lobata TaxID=97700 RepID=A0A7N2L3Y7_QUELO